KTESINNEYVLVDSDKETGVGLVTVEDNGDNRIIVVPGANLAYTASDLEKITKLIKQASIVVLQLEMDIKTVEAAINIAYENNVPIILNPAPGQMLEKSVLSKVTYLTPNETEMEILSNKKLNKQDELILAAKDLINEGVQNVIITLGEEGSLVVNK